MVSNISVLPRLAIAQHPIPISSCSYFYTSVVASSVQKRPPSIVHDSEEIVRTSRPGSAVAYDRVEGFCKVPTDSGNVIDLDPTESSDLSLFLRETATVG